MITKHTPGPWSIDPNDPAGITADCDGLVVAEIPYGDEEYGMRHHEVNEANARLIAAAPDLLNALRAFVIGMDKSQDTFKGHSEAFLEQVVLQRAIEAIAKASGKES